MQVTPTVVKYKTDLRFEILQGAAPRVTVALPAAQALTKLQGEGVRDWQIKPAGGQQVLTVEFIRPVEKSYALTLFSEETVESSAATAPIAPPRPLEVEREAGSVTVSAEDVSVETETTTGLRQVNATGGALAAYQFYSRPFMLALRLRRVEPVVNVADRVTVRLEESRLLVTHALSLNVEKAGIYVLELAPQTGLVVADVRGEGVEDWKTAGGKLTVNFSSRVLGNRRLEVQLEQALKAVPDAITIAPLPVTGAAKTSAQIGAAGAPGIQLKTAADGLVGLREVPINLLSGRTDEALAYNSQQPEWKLVLTAERMAPRITADVFNLITIGDGLLGGSATIRYAIINQGVQEFRVKVPVLWKNVEFTGPNIRRKELQTNDTWVIGLQDKAWGGYTLVVTYDCQFDPHKATLPIGGIHPDGVERETGSVAITSAANLQITTQPNGDNIRRVDESELAGNDRSLVTRPVLMAYKYQGAAYGLSADLTRFEELPVLDAAADRTQLTTVLTGDGQMLTQASFMVKNNDRQFQTFTLPEGADFWACYVAGEPVKPEKNGGKLLVPLPRRANRDEAFAVDIVYVQKIDSLKSLTPHRLALAAPETDMQTTYAEWELYVPTTHRLAGFGGNMIVARGTTYGLRDAWLDFCRFYDALYHQIQDLIIPLIVVAGFVALIVVAIRRGWRGAIVVIAAMGVFVLLAAMLLPALSSSREKARSANSMSNLKQIGLGLGMFADQHGGRLPNTLDEIKGVVGSEKIFYDVESDKPFIYVGAGKMWQENPADVLAYSPVDMNGRNVLFNDGHVEWMSSARFGDALSLNMAADKEKAKNPVATGISLPDKAKLTITRGIGGFHPSSGGNVLFNDGHVESETKLAITPGGGGGSVPVLGDVPILGAVAPMVAGIRPIRIDIPRTGVRFVFTKVLNVGKEPLSVRAVVMDDKVFRAVRGAAQVLASLVGLALVGWQFRRTTPNSLLATIGLALAIAGVVSLLLSTRLLGVAMIAGAPVLALAVVIVLVRRWWKKWAEGREKGGDDGGSPGGSPSSPETVVPPPVVVAIVLLLFAVSNAQAETPVPPRPAASILSATYTGTVRASDAPSTPSVARFEALLELESTAPNQTVRLFGPAVAVQEFSGPKSGGWLSSLRGAADAQLIRDGQHVSVLLPKQGRTTLRLKFLVKLGGDAAKRQVAFGIPPALTSRVSVTLDEPEATVEVPAAVSLKSTPTGQQTLVEAVLGAGDHVELTWTPRMKRAAEIATTVFCQNASLVTFGGGVVNVRSVLDYQVTQGELRQMQVKLPVGQQLMRVDGDGIRTWKLDAQTLTVELVKGVSTSYRLTLETEKLQGPSGQPTIGTSGAVSKVEVPHALDVKRETGLVALKTTERIWSHG